MSSEKEFLPIPISEFTKGVQIPVDLYIRVGEEKFILVAKANTKSDVEQFKNYQDKEVMYLWVLKSEFYKMAHQSLSLAGIALTKKDLDGKQKTFVVTHAARAVFRQLEHIGMDMATFHSAKQITDAVIGLVESQQVLADLLSSLSQLSDQLLSHSMAVSALSVLIGIEMGFSKRATLEKLAIGGLLHDIGKKALPAELLEKPLGAMSNEEIQIFETHSFRGMQMLQSLGVVSDDIVSIVYEHHENALGQGYPQRLRDLKIHPLARIVAMADGFACLTLPNVNCPAPKNPREALLYIEHTLGTPFNRDVFKALKRLFDADKKQGAA